MTDMKAETFNPTKQRKADRYLWYWKPPFGDTKSRFYFDRDHWWKRSRKDVSHDAALYELIRRHPTMGKVCQTIYSSQERTKTHDTERVLILKGPNPVNLKLEPDPVYHVANAIFGFCFRPWTKLTSEQQATFQSSIKAKYPGKGRDLTKGVFNLSDTARKMAEDEKDVGGPSFEEVLKDMAAAYASDERLILAIDTDFRSKNEAEAVLKQLTGIFQKHMNISGKLVRARSVDWFLVIEAFENEFAVDGDAKFKIEYPPTFKKFIGLFEDEETREKRAWWKRHGRKYWAADLNSKSS